ncbi:MAG: hypothetical protein ABI837_15470 [Acidobacteriota bacterium]
MTRPNRMALLLLTLTLAGCRFLEVEKESAARVVSSALFHSLFRLQTATPLTQNSFKSTVGPVPVAEKPDAIEAPSVETQTTGERHLAGIRDAGSENEESLNAEPVSDESGNVEIRHVAEIRKIDVAELIASVDRPRIEMEALFAASERPDLKDLKDIETIVSSARQRVDTAWLPKVIARTVHGTRCKESVAEQTLVLFRTL